MSIQISNWNEYFMRIANEISRKSKDPRTKVGAVIVRENHIISTGFNGFPIGVKDDTKIYSNRDKKYDFIAHAERNAIDVAARFGIALQGSSLYVQFLPCNECAKSIIQSGIKNVFVIQSMMRKMLINDKLKHSFNVTLDLFKNNVNVFQLNKIKFDQDIMINGEIIKI